MGNPGVSAGMGLLSEKNLQKNRFAYILKCSCTRTQPIYHRGKTIMSQHSSLKSASKIATKRNVLKRFERVDLMQKRGKWNENMRGTGLPKTKSE